MSRSQRIESLSAEDGLSFLEHLAHNLTVAVRIAAGRRQPQGPLSDEEARKAMYWINEALHNVVQLTRNLRLGREVWDATEIKRWLDLWLGYQYAQQYIYNAVEQSFDDIDRS